MVDERGGSDDAAAGALGRAVRLTAPPACGAIVAAWFAESGAGTSLLAFGVALGAAVGAGVAALFERAQRRRLAAARRRRAVFRSAAREAPTRRPDAEQDVVARFVRALPTPAVVLDGRASIIAANAGAEELFGAAALDGGHVSTVLRNPALVDSVEGAYRDAAEDAVDFVIRRDGGRHLRAYVAPLDAARQRLAAQAPDAADRTAPPMRGHPHIALLFFDETRSRRAEQLNRDFVANASHELKTPLATISGFIETLLGAARDDPPARERFLTMLDGQAARMRALVEDLLSLNRIELNEHVRPDDAVPLDQVVDAALAALPAARERIRIAGSLRPPPVVRGDEAELTRALVNLLDNALKYGGEGRMVTLRVDERRSDAGAVEHGLAVEDQGPGVDKEHLPRLTERFYRTPDASARVRSGTGLGLAIVKHIVARHRGALEIDSALGRGSRFAMWIPSAAAGPASERPETGGSRRATAETTAKTARDRLVDTPS